MARSDASGARAGARCRARCRVVRTAVVRAGVGRAGAGSAGWRLGVRTGRAGPVVVMGCSVGPAHPSLDPMAVATRSSPFPSGRIVQRSMASMSDLDDVRLNEANVSVVRWMESVQAPLSFDVRAHRPVGALDRNVQDFSHGRTKEEEVEVQDPQSSGRELEAQRTSDEQLLTLWHRQAAPPCLRFLRLVQGSPGARRRLIHLDSGT